MSECEFLWKLWDLNFAMLHSLTRISKTDPLYKEIFDEGTNGINNLKKKINWNCRCEHCQKRRQTL